MSSRPKYYSRNFFGPRGAWAGCWYGVVYHTKANIDYWARVRDADDDVKKKFDRIKGLTPVGLLRYVGVSNRYRGKGLGDHALAEFLLWCNNNGCRYAILEAATTNKQKSGFDLLEWYRKRGFKPVGTISGNWICMICNLRRKPAG